VSEAATRSTPAYLLRVGSLILESPDHPAVVTRVFGVKRIKVWCRYVWQRESEPHWELGTFDRDELVELVAERRQDER
jgi:hypothetical protein